MFTIETDIHIDAPAQTVWQVLTDQSNQRNWNPFIHKLAGKLMPGETIEVELGDAGSTMAFKPKVLVSEPGRELRWMGKLGLRGVLDAEHVFEFEPTESGTHFLHYEHFSGLMAPLFRKKLLRETKPGFEAMNKALKAQAESQHIAGMQ